MNPKGPGWILCPSKTYPGFLYYFNRVSGETVWNLNCLPQSSPQGVNPSTLERNLVQNRNTKTVEFGKSEFPKYINYQSHKQKTDVKRTHSWNRGVTQINNFSPHSTETGRYKNVQVFKQRNESTQTNFTPSQSNWWNIDSNLKHSNCVRENAKISNPFRLKSPKIKRLTKHHEPIRSPILQSLGFSYRNAQINQTQDITSQGSKQENLGSDDLRWRIMLKKMQKSASAATSQMRTKDERKAVVAPNRKVNFFIDITDEESLKLNGDIGNDGAVTVPSRLVLLNQNGTSQRNVLEDNLFLQNTSTLDPFVLSKSLQKNDLISLRTNSFYDAITLNETCDGLMRLNLNEQLYTRDQTYSNVEAKLSTLCEKYENLQDHIMTARIEEWICCYMQIMEQFLHDIFQVTNSTKFEPPCWFLQGLKRFKDVFSHHKAVCVLTDLMLSVCGYCVEKGIVRTNIKPKQFIKLFCGGMLLIEESMKLTQDVDVLIYKDMLQQLTASIRNPNIVSDMQAIDVGYLGGVRFHTMQSGGHFHSKSHNGATNMSGTVRVSQKQPIKNKYVTNINDSDCRPGLQISDDGPTDIYNTGLNFANHNDSLVNINIINANTHRQNTDNIDHRTDIDVNDSFHINAHEDLNNCNIDDQRLTRTAVLTRDYNDVNGSFNEGIDEMIVRGRKDNLNNDNCNSQQGNDHGINDNEVNRVSVDGNVNRDETDVEINTIDGNVIDVIRTMVNTTRMALEELKVYCENCYNELRNGCLTDGRKQYLCEATNNALVKVTAMLLELKGITKRDESNDSPIQQILGDQGESYRMCIKNCFSQTLIVESTLKYILQAINTATYMK